MPKNRGGIKGKQRVEYILKNGRLFSNSVFGLRVLRSDTTRVVVVVSKKIDKRAVYRNKVRRRVVSATKGISKYFIFSAELVLIVKKKVLCLDFSEIKSEIENICFMSGLIRQIPNENK